MSQGRDFRYNGYQMSQHKPGFSQGETELELLPVTAAERFTSDAAARKPVQPRGPKADTWSSQAKRWTPGFWRRFPVLGMLALLAVVIGTIGAIAILINSNNKPIDNWGYGITPAVYLAIVSVVCNASLAYALTEGLTILFWRNTLQGHTLSELNRSWLCGQSLKQALSQGYRAGGRVAALACILSGVSVLRGPLNQRASAVQSNVRYDTSGNMSLAVAQQLPTGYTGVPDDGRVRSRTITSLTPTFAEIMQEYSLRSNITIDTGASSCGESCSTTIKGFGFTSQCDTSEVVFSHDGSLSYEQQLFSVSSSLYNVDDPNDDPSTVTGVDNLAGWENTGIRFNATYSVPLQDGDADGQTDPQVFRLRSHICLLTGSIMEYHFELSSNSAQLSTKRSDDEFIEAVTLDDPYRQGTGSTVGGFQYAASYLFGSSVNYKWGGTRFSAVFTGSLANQAVKIDNIGTGKATVQDPMDQMLDALREITFRTAVEAGKDTSTHNVTNAVQSVEYRGYQLRSIYITDPKYMIAAAILSVLSIIAVGATFYGWWKLGRPFSMGPLELASAFEAPLLKAAGKNAVSDDNTYRGTAREPRVQFGEKVVDDNGQFLSGTANRRLVLGLATDVQRPRKGMMYS
ncbi:unnamed protein product [Alternaria burnsii]|nr:unnamed protein product [Alternaria burnsii]